MQRCGICRTARQYRLPCLLQVDNLGTHRAIVRYTHDLMQQQLPPERWAVLNLTKLLNAVHGMQTVSSVLACWYLITRSDRIISHSFQPYNPWHYALTVTYAPATDEKEDTYDVLTTGGSVAMSNASDDYVHCPAELKGMPAFAFLMMAEKEPIPDSPSLQAQRLTFGAGHPQHATRCVRLRERPKLLQAYTGIPSPPAADTSLQDKDRFAGFMLGNFVVPHRLQLPNPLKPGDLYAAFTEWMDAPNDLFDKAAKQMVRNLTNRSLATQEARKAALIRRAQVRALHMHMHMVTPVNE